MKRQERMALHQTVFPVVDYDLGATLDSGQAFRWEPRAGGWEGVLDSRWVRLWAAPGGIAAATVADPGDWGWLRNYLAVDEDLAAILACFPAEAPLNAAVAACHGLRLLRQDPWECLASFLLSSTKQIVQIRQGVARLAALLGTPVLVPAGGGEAFAFPTAGAVAAASESQLRTCGIGFRARYLRSVAGAVASGAFPLDSIRGLPLGQARERLMELPGVGRKIADCVLLFAYGQAEAFPVDVWVLRGLRDLYFAGRSPGRREVQAFSETHFGPQAGYAQQYLFHSLRLRAGRVRGTRSQEVGR